MSRMPLVFAVCVSLVVSTGAVCAVRADEPTAATSTESDLGVLLQTIRANRKAFVSVNLGLSAEEAEKFWPLYDRYQSEMNPIGDRMASIIEDYTASFRTMSNEKALEIVKSYLDAQAKRIEVQRSYVDQFAKVLPGRTVARFYQIENKMDAVLRYDLAATIPVIEESATKR